MKRQQWLDLSPSVVLGVGIIGSTLISVRGGGSGWLFFAGPLLLALTVVCADVLHSRLKGRPSGPSWATLLSGGAFLVAGMIVSRDPNLVSTLIPICGSAAWITVLLHPEGAH